MDLRFFFLSLNPHMHVGLGIAEWLLSTVLCITVIHVSAAFDDYNGWRIRRPETPVYVCVCWCVRACVLCFSRDSSREGSKQTEGWKGEEILDALSYRYIKTHVYTPRCVVIFSCRDSPIPLSWAIVSCPVELKLA
ncbi:hypothetical protein B9Z19DRAFT_1096747 [Tuber borchii]|uniref:Uncharacterized protein n=1 Tax=Tuber borchii TaxID=42251 RepID=A0A2T6ZB23_TUBBO|nr:hypothetical protein B9Z19DRAFT_1096747 [Tuber borchii]